jgi:hypothetical protein
MSDPRPTTVRHSLPRPLGGDRLVVAGQFADEGARLTIVARDRIN